MDKHDVSRTITFNRSCNVLKVNPSGKKKTAYGAKRMPKQKTISNLNSFQFSASPALILGTTKNATFAHFKKKSMHLKTGFLSDYQVFFLLLSGPQIETSLWFNRSISIDL